MSKYILSTMTSSVSYGFYKMVGEANKTTGGPLPEERRQKITIRGGAGLPSDRSGIGEMVTNGEGRPIWTAAGFVTPVSDEDYEELKEHPIFKKHVEANLVRVLNSEINNANHTKIAKEARSMEQTTHLQQMNPSRLKQRVKVTESLSQQGSEFRL